MSISLNQCIKNYSTIIKSYIILYSILKIYSKGSPGELIILEKQEKKHNP